MQTLIKFAIHFRELQVEGGDWEQRVTYVYYTEVRIRDTHGRVMHVKAAFIARIAALECHSMYFD